MPRRPRITDEERELFRAAVAGTTPLPDDDSVAPDKPRPKPVPRQRHADERAVLEEMAADIPPDELESGDELLWRKPGVQDSVVRKLKRGHYRIERHVDLHGLSAVDARAVVTEFLGRAVADGAGCVRVVHGKGRGSREGRAVLKQLIGGWLRRNADVIAYASARQSDGGTGALLVLLKKNRRSR